MVPGLSGQGVSFPYNVVSVSNVNPEWAKGFGGTAYNYGQAVAVDASGTSVHNSGPAQWEKKIRELKIPVRVA